MEYHTEAAELLTDPLLLYLNPDPWYVSKAFEIGQEGREVFYTLVAKLQKKMMRPHFTVL